MSKVVFFALARHQRRYFQRLLDETALQGMVVEPAQLPWPRLTALVQVCRRLPWAQLIADKCRERQVKRKYAGGLFRLALRLELLWIGLRLQALLQREQPTQVALWNGAHRYCQVLLALLPPGCGTVFFENGLLPNTTTVDLRGVNFRNSVPRDAQFFRHYPLPDPAAPLASCLVPRKPRNTGLEAIELPQHYIFIPFQDDRDTQVRLFSPWVPDMRALFALGERLAEQGFSVVFKEHPSSRESYPQLHQRCHARLLFANGNSTQQLIEASQFVITLNSTVGLESLLLGKPVLTLGQAFFNIPGLVMHADTLEQLLALAAAFPTWPLDADLRARFLNYMAAEYCIPGSWQDAGHQHVQRVAARMLGVTK